MVKLGEKVIDRVTGFVGTAIARIEYLNGTVQFCVQPEALDPTQMPEAECIDETQLEIIVYPSET